MLLLLLLLLPVGSQATPVAIDDASMLQASYAMCSANARCMKAFYLGVPQNTGYDHTLFAHLYGIFVTQHAAALVPLSLELPETASLWLELMSSTRFCGVNEDFDVQLGCRCRQGAHCDSHVSDVQAVNAEDVSLSASSDVVSLELMLLLAIAAVLGGVFIVVSYSRSIQHEMRHLDALFNSVMMKIK
jgi:hypothetical protein